MVIFFFPSKQAILMRRSAELSLPFSKDSLTRAFVPCRPFWPSLMFAGKAKSLPKWSLLGTNTVAYMSHFKISKLKKLYKIGPWTLEPVGFGQDGAIPYERYPCA
jgi:hypothetical protein